MRATLPIATLIALLAASAPSAATIAPATVDATVSRLTALHGPSQADRIRLGVRQVAERWWPEDGDEAAFAAFCEANFLAKPEEVRAALDRFELVLEEMQGHLHEVRRELTTPLDLDTGPVTAWDRLLSEIDLSAHVPDDLFASKAAFLVLLNFPIRSLDEMLAGGTAWDRDTWARARLAEGFARRTPPQVLSAMTRAYASADNYIAGYNIRMDRLLDARGERLFPEGLRLITHWGLRDELGSRYGDPQGLARQRLIAQVMERIVTQTIPQAAIDNAEVTWRPGENVVKPLSGTPAPGVDLAAREPDTRYAKILEVFHAVAAEDAHDPVTPTFVRRRFERDRQVPEAEVEKLLVSVLASPEVKQVAAEITRRLGRPLEPFDIWYTGFKPRGAYSEAELDAVTRQRYPNVAAFQADLPRILTGLGFSPERSAWLAEHIVVDPSRGAGHAMGAVRHEDKAHLRTRIAATGMDYKGYNIAIHELGHNVEQVFSLNAIDRNLLSGVPNNAFTEALAFVFQQRDLELLGLARPDEASRRAEALAGVWATYEIAGVSLVDMQVWRWLYAHPQATPAELREATVAIARDVWNRYFAPVIGTRDSLLLGVYSHMVAYALYLPDYALGHLIAFQVAEHFHGRDFGREFERVARQGRLTPEAWMRGAVGAPLSAEPLLAAARAALKTESTGVGKK
ncbi:MAG: hypothetical protein IPJ17_20155 [Holophagales bacterium]|nr:MAG: hypothetical protein IPJ17_20155 [Holophagales bacterium]